MKSGDAGGEWATAPAVGSRRTRFAAPGLRSFLNVRKSFAAYNLAV
jgi:hypothetical protein